MIKIEILKRCILCGRETNQRSHVCLSCINKIPLIEDPSCRICGSPLLSENGECLRCRLTNYSFDKNISLFEYKGKAKDLLYLYKFENCRSIAWLYSELFARIIANNGYADYLIVASPASAAKKRKKGWDQVEQICGILKKTNRFKVVQVLKKKSATGQKMLSLEDRKKNLKGKIHCTLNGASLIQEKKILLIDDVFTTGATADECSSVLKKNGASRVVSLTVAVD